MRNETLLKVIIAVFAIVLIVLATFVYGNVQRSKQKATTNSNQATVTPPATSSKDEQNNTPAAKPASPAPMPTPAPAVVPVAPAPAKTTTIPNTGSEGAVIPMTILAVMGYLAFANKKLARSKSELR